MYRLASLSLSVFFLTACGENPAPVESTEAIDQESHPVITTDTRPNYSLYNGG
jgi:PBP1b-binding outer membrane lipoprotein LpoB